MPERRYSKRALKNQSTDFARFFVVTAVARRLLGVLHRCADKRASDLGGRMGFAADAITDVITPPPRAERAAARDDGPSFAQHLDKQDDAAARPEKPRAEKPTAERPHRASADDDDQDTSDDDTVEAAAPTIAQPQTETTPAAPLLTQFLAQLKSAPSADAKPVQTADTPPAQAPQQGDAGLAPQLPPGGIAGQAAEPQQAAQQAAESLPQLAPATPLPGVKAKGASQTADRDAADSAPSVAPAQAPQPAPEATAAIVQTPVAPDTTPQAARETQAPAINASAARTAKTQAPVPEAPAPDTPPPAEAPKSATPLQQALSALRDGANAANSGEKNSEIRIAAPAHTGGPAAAPIAQPAVQTAPASAEHAAAQRVASAGAQVGHEIVKRFSGGNTRFEMRLDPPELGRIEVRLEVSRDNKVSAVIAADSPQALSDLVRHARDLEASLQSAGLDLAENGLSFDLNQSGQRFADEGDGASARQGAASNDDPAPVTTARPLGLESWRGVRIDVMA